MATNILAQEDDRGAEAAEQVDFEDQGNRINDLLALAQWIERARQLIRDVEQGVQVSPSFAANVQHLNIAWADGYWEDDESNGLRQLLLLVKIDCRDSHDAGFQLVRRLRAQEVSHG